MSFIAIITTVGAVAGIASAGASMYNQYKQGKTLEDTDWTGMSKDVVDMYKQNLGMLRDQASNVFSKIEAGWKAGVGKIGDTATSMWDQASQGTRGFAGDDAASMYDMSQTMSQADRDADSLSKNRDLQEEETQIEFERKELALEGDMEQELGELGSADKASDKWYPGKYIGKAISSIFSDDMLKEDIVLVGQSPSKINIYEFNYLGNPIRYRGVMAGEVQWAAEKDENGFDMVDYSVLDVDFERVN